MPKNESTVRPLIASKKTAAGVVAPYGFCLLMVSFLCVKLCKFGTAARSSGSAWP